MTLLHHSRKEQSWLKSPPSLFPEWHCWMHKHLPCPGIGHQKKLPMTWYTTAVKRVAISFDQWAAITTLWCLTWKFSENPSWTITSPCSRLYLCSIFQLPKFFKLPPDVVDMSSKRVELANEVFFSICNCAGAHSFMVLLLLSFPIFVTVSF